MTLKIKSREEAVTALHNMVERQKKLEKEVHDEYAKSHQTQCD